MIDPADKQTQPLNLDETPAKRKRGRPATGKAMTPAEKQRAYRQRKKALDDDIGARAKEGKCTELEATRLVLHDVCGQLEKAYAEIKRLRAAK